MHISQNIRHLRKQQNLNQKQLADVLNIKTSQVSAYETGESFPRFDGLLKLSELFGVGLDDLVFRDLSQEQPQGRPDPSETYEQRTQRLLDMLESEVERYRQAIRQHNPELARQLGIGD